MESVFYGLKIQNNMDIKLKYRAWVGEKHADISNPLTNSDIETFAIEFAEWLVKNCSIPAVVGQSEQLKPKEQICYKSNEPCKYDCSGLCKESC